MFQLSRSYSRAVTTCYTFAPALLTAHHASVSVEDDGALARELGGEHEHKPRHLLGIGEVDDLIRGVELGIDTFDCAMPTRLGRHGVAVVPDPENRWRADLMKGNQRENAEPILEGCPCPACSAGYSRAYLHYLLRAGELTAIRLVTLHNLSFVGRLMADLRQATEEGRLADVAAKLRAGASPRATSCTG